MQRLLFICLISFAITEARFADGPQCDFYIAPWGDDSVRERITGAETIR